jgi:ABC-2 type transport system ATP-binding protein
VTRRYGSRVALAPTDLDLRSGELVVLLGPNGAGKSTLLALLAGALPATAGEVTAEVPAVAIGWAPQRPAQYRRLSARENLALFARLLRLDDPGAATERMLAELELPDDDRPSAHLSVGNQQRLNLAIAFLGAPRVLLLDEPTASLDPEQAHALWERVGRARAAGAAVVVATHHLDEAVAADRVLTLRDGVVRPEDGEC